MAAKLQKKHVHYIQSAVELILIKILSVRSLKAGYCELGNATFAEFAERVKVF